MPSNTDIKTNWDGQLATGEENEQEFLVLLLQIDPDAKKISGNYKYADFKLPNYQDCTVEIKKDYKSHYTGNFYFEYNCFGKPSGLAVTTAELWVMTDREYFYLFDTEKLKNFMRVNWQYLRKMQGGDNNASKGIVFKKTEIAQHYCTKIPKAGDARSLHAALMLATRQWV